MKKISHKDTFLNELRHIPIIQVACERSGLSRNTVYRWRNTDLVFKQEMEKALIEGEALVNDMTESQLLSMIKEKNFSAVSFWLKHRNPRYRTRVELEGSIKTVQELSPEQKEMVKKALLTANVILKRDE